MEKYLKSFLLEITGLIRVFEKSITVGGAQGSAYIMTTGIGITVWMQYKRVKLLLPESKQSGI